MISLFYRSFSRRKRGRPRNKEKNILKYLNLTSQVFFFAIISNKVWRILMKLHEFS